MNKLIFTGVILLFSCSSPQTKNDAQSQNGYPEDFGFSSKILGLMIEKVKVEDLNVNSILIKKKGKTVLQAHFYPQKPDYLHDIASISKSITSLIIGIAIHEGHINSVEQKVVEFFPEDSSLFDTDAKKGLTVENLLTMTSGICSDFNHGERLRDDMKITGSPLSLSLGNELFHSPNERFNYCSAGVQILSMIISNSVGMTLENFAIEKLFKPLGITEFIFGTDLNGYTNASGDIFLTAEGLYKIGQLVLNEGEYEGEQIVSKGWINKSTSVQVKLDQQESYGYLWWLRDDLGGLIEAQGRGGQRLIILPEKNIVVVMLGAGFSTDKIGEFIVNAMKSDSTMVHDEKGFNLLKNQLESIQRPYNTIPTKPIPEFANDIYGKKFIFQNNSLGLNYFILNAKDVKSAFFILGLTVKGMNENEERNVPIGLNGEYVISNATRFNTPMAARAEWLDTQSVSIDYNEFSNAHKYKITIDFDDKEASFTIQDEADNGEALKLSAKTD